MSRIQRSIVNYYFLGSGLTAESKSWQHGTRFSTLRYMVRSVSWVMREQRVEAALSKFDNDNFLNLLQHQLNTNQGLVLRMKRN